MDISQFAMGSFAVIGFVNGVQLAFNKEWVAFLKFVVAVVAGGLFGYLKWFGLPGLEIGLAVGIASSGVYKSLSKFAGT